MDLLARRTIPQMGNFYAFKGIPLASERTQPVDFGHKFLCRDSSYLPRFKTPRPTHAGCVVAGSVPQRRIDQYGLREAVCSHKHRSHRG